MSALITRRRLSRLTGVVSTQLAVQAIGFASGILLVRHMEQAQYGFYTLAISMVGVGNVLMDLGLATAVLAVGGQGEASESRHGALLNAALSLQRRLAILSGLVLLPGFVLMFVQQGLDPLKIAVLSLVVIVCIGFNARNQIALSLMRLRGDLMLQQRLEIFVNAGKLLLVLAAVMVYVDATIAVTANLIAAAATFALLMRYLTRQDGLCEPAPQEHADRLRNLVIQQAPNSLYYCVSGQISIWLVGFLGSADRVAEAGALGRLALFFTVVGAVVTALVQPYFARTLARRDLIAGFVALNIFFCVATTVLVNLAALVPGALLWILGPRYGALGIELVWMVLAASMAAWSGAIYSVSAARGWVVPSALVIPMGVTTLAVSACLIDMSTVAGSFKMNTATAAMATALTIAFGAFKLNRASSSNRQGAPL